MNNNTYWLLSTGYSLTGGGEPGIYAWHTARMLARHGHKVTVFVFDNTVAEVSESFPQKDIRLMRFGERSLQTAIPGVGGAAKISWLFSVMVLQKIKEEGVPEFIESQDSQALAYYLLMEKSSLKPELKDVKIIINVHHPEFAFQRSNGFLVQTLPRWWDYELELRSLPLADGILFSSQRCMIGIFKYLTGKLPVNCVINMPYEPINGFPFARYDDSKCIYYIVDDKWDENDNILDVYAKIINGRPEFPGLNIIVKDSISQITGKNSKDYFFNKYKMLIDNGKFKFIDIFDSSKVQSLLNSARIIVAPSSFKILEYSLLEALYQKRCIIISEDVIDDRYGNHLNKDVCYKYNYTSKDALKEVLKKASFIDKDSFDEMGENAHAFVKQNYSYDKVYEAKREYLEKINGKIPTLYHFLNLEASIIPNEKEDNPLLSVVVPYYNMGSTFEDTVRSIQECSYQSIEIIVVNASSTDEQSLRILEELQPAYGYRVLVTPNRGLAASRNDGAKVAKGGYLAFLDPDDMVDPNFYERAISVLKHFENVGGVGQGSIFFGGSQGYWPSWNPEPPYILYHNTLCTNAMVYIKDVFLKYGLNDESMVYGMEDYEALISLLENRVGVIAIPDIFLNYRIRQDSMLRQQSLTQRLQAYQMIQKRHIEYFKKYAISLLDLSNCNGSGVLVGNPSKFVGLN